MTGTAVMARSANEEKKKKQDRAKRFELTPVWAPVEPPTKRAKTAEVRLSSASDVPMPARSDDNAKGSSDEGDSSGSNSDVSSQDDSSDVSDFSVAPLAQAAVSVQNPPSAHKRVSRVVGLGRSGSFRVALGS